MTLSQGPASKLYHIGTYASAHGFWRGEGGETQTFSQYIHPVFAIHSCNLFVKLEILRKCVTSEKCVTQSENTSLVQTHASVNLH